MMGAMRTASDFDSYYQTPDPWGISRASRRDRALAAVIKPHVAGKSVLELGCGEGHLTATVFSGARSIRGIDIESFAGADRSNGDRRVSFGRINYLYVSDIEESESSFRIHNASRKSRTRHVAGTSYS
jgi:2-polyprenyl-3-methyl-5-hydroxy-6-metoxy-1,4-benzoquinol methylase